MGRFAFEGYYEGHSQIAWLEERKGLFEIVMLTIYGTGLVYAREQLEHLVAIE